MAVLKVINGKVPGQILELQGERTIFGRHPNCQIVLDDAAVSRHHAQILQTHGNYYLEDLSSRNGTQLNSDHIEGRTELHDGDEIDVCDLVFCFHTKAPPEDSHRSKKSDSASGSSNGGEASWVHTATEADGSRQFVIEESPAEASLESSSIVTTLNVDGSGGSSGVRFSVKPEVKLQAILGISEALSNVLDLDQVLSAILDTLFRIYPHCDEGFVLLEDPDQESLSVKAIKTRRERDEDDLPISMTIVRQAMESRTAILSANAVEDQRFKPSESLSGLQLHSVMCVPLVNRESDRALGVIQIAARSLGSRFSQEDLELLISVATQGALAIENARLHTETMRQRDLERDLEYATQIQLGFLPSERPKIADYEFAHYYEAAQSVGGDYFDYVPLPGGKIALTLGDVAGKGVPAALLMARLYSMARYHLLTSATVAETMTNLNSELAFSGLGHRFITCIMAVLDPATNELTVANAGHMPPIIRHPDGVSEELSKDFSGLPLGVNVENAYAETMVTLGSGDALLVYTDGVTEAMNARSEIFGCDRLLQSIGGASADVNGLIQQIVADIERFADGRPQSDDTCLVCVRRLPEDDSAETSPAGD